MSDKAIIPQLTAAVENGDLDAARAVLEQHPGLLAQYRDGAFQMRLAARKNNPSMIALLAEFGGNINAPELDGSPEGPVADAAGFGAVDAVRWFLEHGAPINNQVNGVVRCIPLSRAIIDGHFEVVRVLVEGGADFNAAWANRNALTYAIMYKRKEIEDYLRSKGAVEPGQTAPPSEPEEQTPVLNHARAHFGKVDSLAFRDILPLEKSVVVRVATTKDSLILFTDGMSDEPAGFPSVPAAEQYAELMIYLPLDWPIAPESLKGPELAWPISLLRSIAHSPLKDTRVLDAQTFLFSHGEPPAPFASNTHLSCALARREQGDRGQFALPDGKAGYFYGLWPLYVEERNVGVEFGADALLKLFKKQKVSKVVDPRRRNTALDR
jgi:hypothetical protein